MDDNNENLPGTNERMNIEDYSDPPNDVVANHNNKNNDNKNNNTNDETNSELLHAADYSVEGNHVSHAPGQVATPVQHILPQTTNSPNKTTLSPSSKIDSTNTETKKKKEKSCNKTSRTVGFLFHHTTVY